MVENGESTRIWSDSWIHPESNLKPYGPAQLEDQDFLVADLLRRETNEWNKSILDRFLPELTDHILSINSSVLNLQDT